MIIIKHSIENVIKEHKEKLEVEKLVNEFMKMENYQKAVIIYNGKLKG